VRFGDWDVPKRITRSKTRLFYSCGTCNSLKGKFWPSEEEKAAGRFVVNPCDYVMRDHLRALPNGVVDSSSPAGDWTVDLLRLNESAQIKRRYFFLAEKKRAEESERQLAKRLAVLKAKLVSAVGDEHREMADDIARLDQELDIVQELLSYIVG
jgi:hypothetical protein